MQMEQGTQQEWDREFIHQETGEPHYIHVTGFINDVQGAKKCIVDLSDRTGEHQTTLAVEAALEVAEKASQAKTDFLSNMSHDIRNPHERHRRVDDPDGERAAPAGKAGRSSG